VKRFTEEKLDLLLFLGVPLLLELFLFLLEPALLLLAPVSASCPTSASVDLV
jgi:hypothetical protein